MVASLSWRDLLLLFYSAGSDGILANSLAEPTFVPDEQSNCTAWTILIAPVSTGEGACGGPVDRVLSLPMRSLVSFGPNDKSSSGRQVTRWRDIVVRFDP